MDINLCPNKLVKQILYFLAYICAPRWRFLHELASVSQNDIGV